VKFSTRRDDFSCAEIIDDLPVAFFIKDLDHRILGCNKTFLELIGKTEEEVLEREVKEVIPADMKKNWQGTDAKVIASGAIQEFEVVLEHPDSSKTFWTVRKICYRDKSGEVIGILGTIIEITKIKQAQESQAEEHRLLRTVIDILPAFIYAKDSDCRFILANQVVAGYLGCKDPDELLGKTDFDFLPHKYAIKYYCDEQGIIISGRPVINILESCGTEENSTPLWLNTTKVPFRDAEGKILGIVGSGIDITQKKLVDDRLHELQEIVNHSKSCAFLLSSFDNWKVRFCTKTVDLFEYMEEDFSLNGLNFLEIVHPEDCEKVKTETLQNFKDGLTTFSQEYRIKTKNGSYCWVEDQKYLRDIMADGTFVFQSLITDVSKKHQYQQERDAMEIQLRQAQKLEAVGQLAAGIAHEINTPIQFINDNLQFLSDSTRDMKRFVSGVFGELESTDPALQKLGERIRELAKECDLDFLIAEVPSAISQSLEGADRVRDIVQAMKEFSHPGSGEITQDDINKAIRNTITVARNEWKYISDIETDLSSDTVSVPVDIGPFKQTILNLIVNAAHSIEDRVKRGDFTKGKITIITKKVGNHAMISVQDTGMGIPEKITQRIFDPFFTTKEVGKGSGQGLAMAYDIIVRKHKGKLYFRTRPGQGTTFFIELPMEERHLINETGFSIGMD
jgi:two-component system, NtrC family, sensor kinase